MQVARDLGKQGKGRRIVVLLPDTGRNYLTKIYSDDWMEGNGFMEVFE